MATWSFLDATIDPLKILNKTVQARSLVFLAFMTGYICLSLFLFFQWVNPSLDGRSSQRIAADSITYMEFADSLRRGETNPVVIAALSSFPNTLLCPVMLALVLKSTFAMVVANYAMVVLALVLLKRTFSLSLGTFIALLLLNATTTISLLSVNKEIVDLLVVSIFLFARKRHHNGVLLLALLLALFSRFQVCAVMLVFLLAESRFNPWRRRRVVTILVLIVALSIMLPFAFSGPLQSHILGVDEGHTIVAFNFLEMHYMYGVAVIPKVAFNLFGMFLDAFRIETLRVNSDIANSYIPLSNNIANVVVFVFLLSKRRLTVRSDIIYFSMIGSIIMATALILQCRYFYFVYVLLCLQAAQTGTSETTKVGPIHG